MSPELLISRRVHGQLRDALLSGRFGSGTVLVVQALAEEFGVSQSPVRDVLHRMVGEGLLHLQPTGGFVVPTLSARGLHDLYMWHWQLVRLAVKSRQDSPYPDAPYADLQRLDNRDSHAVADQTATLFMVIARHSRNREHGRTIGSVNDRLHATRLRETALRNRAQELQTLWTLLHSPREAAFQNALWVYHRRRLKTLSCR